MIRPRGGDFLYSNYEYHAMRHDIEMCKRLGADGVALGILKPDGTLDKERCKRLIDYARPLKVTCHRAFDMTRDPFEALEACIEVGFDRILTAGQQPKAVDGVACIAELASRANGRIVLIPGSGVNESTVGAIISETGAREIHVSATRFSESAMVHRNDAISTLGSTEGSEYKIRSVDPDRVRKIRRLAEMKRA
jgi:copper homeostasis protein